MIYARLVACTGLFLLGANGASAARIFVKATGDDARDGLSWATAKATPAAALDLADSTPEPDTIRVAEGTYSVSGFLVVEANVTLLGGYPPGGGTERDPRAHPTILDRAGARGHVVYFEDRSEGSTIDGFNVRHGTGGIRVLDSGPLIRDCIIEQNDGGSHTGILGTGLEVQYQWPSWLPLRVEDCVIRDNVGGMTSFGSSTWMVYVNAPAEEMELGLVMSRTFVEGNVPAAGTGVSTDVVVYGGRVRLQDVALRDNVDGVLLVANADMTNVLAPDGVQDRATRPGPCMPSTWRNVTTSSIWVSNCSLMDPANRVVVDSIIWGTDPAVTEWEPGDVAITHSIVQGGWPSGTNVIDADPLWVPGPAGDFYLSAAAAGQAATSPAVDAGSVTAEDAGMDARTTRTDSVADSGMVDLGYHPEPILPGGLSLRRGPVADGLSPYRIVADLPFTDTEGTLSGPWFRLLYYDIANASRDIIVRTDPAGDAVRVEWR